MKPRTRKYLVIMLIVAIVFFTVGGHFINKYYTEWATSHPKKYCYDFYSVNRKGKNVVNTALYVKNKQDMDALIKYYKEIEDGNMSPIGTFPLFGFPTDTCVYVLGYKKDSLIAEVICYSKHWGTTGSYKKGYVYIGTLHDAPPPKNE